MFHVFHVHVHKTFRLSRNAILCPIETSCCIELPIAYSAGLARVQSPNPKLIEGFPFIDLAIVSQTGDSARNVML